MKVMIVEDDAYFARLLTEFLADNGLNSEIIQGATEALTIDAGEYGAALIDVMLPNVPEQTGISNEESRAGFCTGIALARRLQKKLPVILISSDESTSLAASWARENEVPFLTKLDSRNRLLTILGELDLLPERKGPTSFIVHGHDDALVLELKNYIQNTLGWPEPFVLREMANAGRTVIEKFEEASLHADWVFVLMTPDDTNFHPTTNDEMRRARQNVIFELGYFYGLIGRHCGKVIVMKKGGIELPSDTQGIVWINVENGINASGEDIRREVGA
jgi:CheY-like chemotaxis protein